MLEILYNHVYAAISRCNVEFNKYQKLKESQLQRLCALLSDVFEKELENKNIIEPLEFALNWRPFPIYLQMCSDSKSFLSQKTISFVMDVNEEIRKCYENIMNRSIAVGVFDKLKTKQDRFISMVERNKDLKPSGFKKTLELCSAELKAFLECRDNLKKFVDLCQRFEVDTSDLDRKIQLFSVINNVPLKELCEKGSVPHEMKKYAPTVKAFEIDARILNVLPQIIKCSNGCLFMRIWDEYGRKCVLNRHRALSIIEVVTDVWEYAHEEWKSLHQKLKSGDIYFKTFDAICGRMELNTLRKEFQILEDGKNPSWIKDRVEQLNQYKNLQCCLDGACIIIKVRDEFQLEGDFKPIEKIVDMTNGKDTKMKKLNKSHLRTVQILDDMDTNKVNCLQKFIDSKPLVDWLREMMSDGGLQELKTFVDLAYISTGDDPMSIAKIRCLQSAAIGYAPLIFNLDNSCGYKEFLDRCQEVWNSLNSNPNLPQEIEDTCHDLEWLKIVEQSHGSVEVTSLAQAEAINANGIYNIKCTTKDLAKLEYNQSQLELSDVLHLKVIESQENKTLHRNYTYAQLHDLQSRLMLVAGKAEMGKDDVDRFILILDSVVRLCNVFIKLLSSGCVLFSKFKVKVRCDPETRVCVFVSFGEGDTKRTIRGNIDERNKDVSYFVPRIAKFMENCHQKWLDFIDDKREEFYILNYFTIEQMVILQQELVKMGFDDEPSVLVYPMLSTIKQGCTKNDLIDAMEEAREELSMMKVEGRSEGQETEQPIEDKETLKVKFIQELMDAGNSKALAIEALNHCCPDQIEEGIRWCIEHEDDLMECDDTFEDQGKLFSGWNTSSVSMAVDRTQALESIGVYIDGMDSSVDDMIKNLEDLWKAFSTDIVSSSKSDYLSVEHLAQILKKLSYKDSASIDRSFSVCGYIDGEPNLIICPQSEMFNTLLSIYSTEDDSPLPQADEVLLCTPKTTLDMLEIFWRRAIYAESGKIYSLVNADLLEYEVSDKGEKSLEKHVKNGQAKELQFKLVVICSAENEFRSRMVAALEKFRRPQITFGGEKHVKNYLSQRFVVNQPISDVEPGSFVDFKSSSVRIVKSWRAGVGKSLFKRNMVASLRNLQLYSEDETDEYVITIPLYDKCISIDSVIDTLICHTRPPDIFEPRIFHLDISHEVQEGVDALLFQLLVLGCLSHSSGHVWRRSQLDYYIIESMPLLARDSDTQVGKLKCMHRCLDILPDVLCRSPVECVAILNENYPEDYQDSDLLFDQREFASEVFQRPYQYLSRFDLKEEVKNINPHQPEGDIEHCLQILLRHCGVRDPSWSELYHFVSFLNTQLKDFESSAFCQEVMQEDLPGFPAFVLRSIIEMSRDFATRSLQISEESPQDMLKRQILEQVDDEKEDYEEMYQMRRTWESSPHSYLFFNPDHDSMTFLGFNIEKETGNLVDDNNEIVQKGIMPPTFYDRQRTLFNGLNAQPGVNLTENFDKLSRDEKITKLCKVMGTEYPHDPDDTYELTTDNVKKILAIYMRFRCDIPVIIMGETGCGKTTLIKFMCALQHMPDETVENIITMKVHGGTTAKDIIKKVKKAEQIAAENAEKYPNMYTVLFFDEANTTEAIGVIKEVMCDKSLGGKPIQIHEKLKIVAACNPYRKHKEELIKKLEQAGLGYHVDADKTTDRLGRVPMRRLVYRVQPLPQSMLPLVWDFGQLNSAVEEKYIKQMVFRCVKEGSIPNIDGLVDVTSHILCACQDFMRNQEDECSFVSLRDVERVLKVMAWFYQQTGEDGILYEEDQDHDEEYQKVEITKAFILALGVCYQACLQRRQDFRDLIVDLFEDPYELEDDNQLETELLRCQGKFLDNVKLADNIAKNQALKENVFMMIVCIELRIPLFLVGKPGSSKSLAKTIVSEAMQGETARSPLFKKYKQVQMVSFQCSPLSTPEGIIGTFKQCAEFQKAKSLDRFVSVVVLDEIGLAEDSPRMPLKTLHPLLEEGYLEDEDLLEEKEECTFEEEENMQNVDPDHNKVAFIGISNWALDPAKMNRGIFVQREVPDKDELIKSAVGICQTSEDKENIKQLMDNLIPSLSTAYSNLFAELEISKQREFFGLRDFYSLIKMVYAFAAKTQRKPTWLQLKHAIMRNFGGLEHFDPVEIFIQCLRETTVVFNDPRQPDDPDCSFSGMIKACLEGDNTLSSETRYLLLLTENYGDLAILQQKILAMHDVQVIFGSSFPSDQEYTQVCRNINRIKVCMETGSTVILLNLENLYESLYDALNQYYVTYGGERYVDLGLGSHRVKCKVHREFRLIVVAEKEIVYKKFPIPLINRLEKHILSLGTMLSDTQQDLACKLKDWVEDFCQTEVPQYLRKREKSNLVQIGDVFIGYHADTCAAIIMQLFEDRGLNTEDIQQCINDEVLHDAKCILLWCAAPDSVIRLPSSRLREEAEDLMTFYYKDQQHDSLLQFLKHQMNTAKSLKAQITTHSKLLSTPDLDIISKGLSVNKHDICLSTLQSFDTEQQFCRHIRFFLEKDITSDKLLIVQCDCGDQNGDLLACARYSIQGELQQMKHKHSGNIHVVIVVQLPRVSGSNFTGFQCGLWHSLHIDDLRPPPDKMPSFIELYRNPISAFFGFEDDKPDIEEMETEDSHETEMDVDQAKETNDVSAVAGKIDILSLITNCVQSALAMVKDPEKDSPRTTERIRMVLHLIQNSEKNEISFLGGVTAHLKCLLKEKEELDTEIQKKWLASEASTQEHINSAGTFRRAAIQCLEQKLSSLLAGIIAFIDKNRNMNIILSEKSKPWQRHLWLEFFSSPQLTCMQYSDFTTQFGYNMLSEYTVCGTAYEGGTFSAVMPFSWLLYRQIDKLLKSTLEEPGIHANIGSVEIIQRAASRFEATPMGQWLCRVEGSDIQQVIQRYVKDFVHISYPVKSEAEHLLICESLMTGCRQIIQGEIGRLVSAIFGCHASFIYYGGRFKNFSDIVHVLPNVCEQMMMFFENEKDLSYLQTTDEITLDLIGLILILKNLEPPQNLNDPKLRKEWVKLICDYRPIVERIIAYFTNDQFGKDQSPRCLQAIKTARNYWTRVMVLKLFSDNICKETMEIKKFKSLSVVLKRDADMKTLATVETVEKILKSCNKEVAMKIFGEKKCNSCNEPFVGCQNKLPSAPVTFPCRHSVCTRCFDEASVGESSKQIKCPCCDRSFPRNVQPIPEDQSENVQAYHDFRKRCNSFFMEVVAQMCFADGTPPAVDVVNKLLSYITTKTKKGKQVTKELNIYDDSIDSTPVVRSFLLQLLMQTSGQDVYTHLENYFTRTCNLLEITETDQAEVHNLCILVLQCMEDACYQRSPIEKSNLLQKALEMLRNACGQICLESDQLLLNMKSISETRFSLGVAASFMYRVYIEKSCSSTDIKIRRLFEAVGKLCEECGSDWPKRYFVKYLCRNYGTDSYQTICADCDMSIKRWIKLPELQREKVDILNDRFIVYGDKYTRMRESFVEAALNEDEKKILPLLHGHEKPWKKEVLFLLVLYREFVMDTLYEGEHQKFSPQVREFLQSTISGITDFSNQELTRDFLTNMIWRYDIERNVCPSMNLTNQGLSTLLVHFMVLFQLAPGQQTLLSPVIHLCQHPEQMVDSYFPAMPQDDLEQIQEALLAARNQEGGDANPVFYRCPNGHLYVIGDCGRPYMIARCLAPGCGLQIGGERHELLADNFKGIGTGFINTGHILGRAENRNIESFPERTLKRGNCAVMKLITHMAMYIGANSNREAVCTAIKPDLQEDDVSSFLIDHIQKDLASISTVLGKSVENVQILIHQLLANIMKSLTTARISEKYSEDICFLKTKQSRQEWEDIFNRRYIIPLLERCEETLDDVTTRVMNDKGLGSDPLLQLMYETEKPIETLRNRLSENPAVWQFRDRISVDHLMQKLMKSPIDCPVLWQFLEEEHFLRALRYIPSIIKLQRILIEKYNRILYKSEASNMTMDRVMMEFNGSLANDIESLWKDFVDAWESVRQYLDGHAIPIDGNAAVLPREICRKRFDDRTSVSYVLPALKDNGLCSYSLLFFLLEKQNLFLQKYCQQVKISYESLPRVHVPDLSGAHLITYHPEVDLIPIVLANCNYSFEVGRGTKVEYNFSNLERQLMDRFLFSKSIIILKDLPVVVYRSETTNAVVFSQLRDKIRQECIGQSVLGQIVKEMQQRDYSDICRSIDNLDIAISFLKSVGSNPEERLHDFMVNVLKIDDPFVSHKAQQYCKCIHVQSLWIQLALEKTKLLEKNKKESFDGVSTSLKCDLSNPQIDLLHEIFGDLQPEQLEMLLDVLFECIYLIIDVPQRDVGIWLKQGIEEYFGPYSYPYTGQLAVPEWLLNVLTLLPPWPKNGEQEEQVLELMCSHIVGTWVTIYDIFTDKMEDI